MDLVILDFDGTMYNKPCKDIPHLEDAIDLAMLRLLDDKLKKCSSPQMVNKVMYRLNSLFMQFDKTTLTANLYNQNTSKSGNYQSQQHSDIIVENENFSDLLKSKDKNKLLICARALGKILQDQPNGEGNHRVSGMLNLGLDITQQEIADYYRKYATIKYKTAEPNKEIMMIVEEAKKRGDKLVIYTDNSKENVIANLSRLGYSVEDFAAIVDMFDCDGGYTKKTLRGIAAFEKIMNDNCIIPDGDVYFYDDNKNIAQKMHRLCIGTFNNRKLHFPNVESVVCGKTNYPVVPKHHKSHRLTIPRTSRRFLRETV